MRDVREITRPDRRLLTSYILSSLTLGPCFLFALIPLYFRYHTLRYQFDEEGVKMSWGILWRREIYLTYSRIQDIHLTSGVIERWLGLATIAVQTAAGKASAEMAIVGIPEYEAIRDFLYTRMRGARFGKDHGGQPPHEAGKDDEVATLLAEIRDSLARIRARTERGG